MAEYNKGEWSELYVFFKLLSEGKLHAANSDLQKIPELFYPILSIIRKEGGETLEYHRDSNIRVVIEGSSEPIVVFSIAEFFDIARSLLASIREGEGNFSIPWLSEWLETLKIVSITSNSRYKSDITVKVLDRNTNLSPILGFSIKSQLGSASTLFNSSQATNFVYSVTTPDNYNPESVNSITDFPKLKRRIQTLIENGCVIKFRELDSPVFSNNLKMVDSRLPELFAMILLNFYCDLARPDLESALATLHEQNPLGVDLSHGHPFYEHKLKSALTEFALGLMPATVWDGRSEATGGFIIVKDDGELVCYHIYNRNDFQDFLLKNTKIDTPSSSRNRFGMVYRENNKLLIKLNLQIRYKK